jgi:hypothetical protein
MKRARRGDVYERFRERKVKPEAAALFSELQNWCKSLDLANAEPESPDELSARQQDVVELLLAIADAAGGDWPKMARHALVELCGKARVQDDSKGERLLADIRDIFKKRGIDRIKSTELVQALIGIETSPWSNWSNRGKATTFTTTTLAGLLQPFEIEPHNIYLAGEKSPKGYEVDDFADGWSRYLPPDSFPTADTPLSSRYTATTRINIDDSGDFEAAASFGSSGGETSASHTKISPVAGVAAEKPSPATDGYLPDASGPGCTCLECDGHFGTLAGWTAHIAQGRCEQVEAAD